MTYQSKTHQAKEIHNDLLELLKMITPSFSNQIVYTHICPNIICNTSRNTILLSYIWIQNSINDFDEYKLYIDFHCFLMVFYFKIQLLFNLYNISI